MTAPDYAFAEAVARRMASDFAEFVATADERKADGQQIHAAYLRPSSFEGGWCFGFHAFPVFLVQVVEADLEFRKAKGDQRDSYTRDELVELLQALLGAFGEKAGEIAPISSELLSQIELGGGRRPRRVIPGPGFAGGPNSNEER